MINNIKTITSRKDAEVLRILNIRKSPGENGFLIEGERFIRDIPIQNIKRIYTTDAEKYKLTAKDVPEVYLVTPPVMEKICGVKSGQDILAEVFITNTDPPDRLIFLDDVQDSGNVGTIIRTAAAFGYGVVTSKKSASPFSEKAARSTAGAIFKCYIERMDTPDFISLYKNKYTFISSELDKNAKSPQDMAIKGRHCIIIGNEGRGVGKEISEASDEKVYIPISNTDSLNAGIAAGILMYAFSCLQ